MKKSLIALALLVASSLAMAALPSSPPAARDTSVAQEAPGIPQVSHGTADGVTAVAAVSAEQRGVANVHPGAGERETHPTFAPIARAANAQLPWRGGRDIPPWWLSTIADEVTSMRAWPSGQAAAFHAAQVGSIPTARSTGST